MSDHVRKVIDHGTRTVDGTEVRIEELLWDNDPGSSFEVYLGDECLTMDGAFDEMPTDREISFLILSSGHAGHTAPELGCKHCEAIDPGTWRERYHG